MAKRDFEPNPKVMASKPGIYMVMGDTAEVVAKRYKVARIARRVLAREPATNRPCPSRGLLQR
jgi:hypothetical protein